MEEILFKLKAFLSKYRENKVKNISHLMNNYV